MRKSEMKNYGHDASQNCAMAFVGTSGKKVVEKQLSE